jgi:hypothetical protein
MLGGGASFSAEVGWPTVMTGLGDMASDENSASTSVVTDDDNIFECRYLCEDIVHGWSCRLTRAALGKTLDPGLSGQMMAASSVVTPLEGIILEQKSTRDGATPGKTPDLGLLDWMMATCGAILPI